MFQQNLNSNNSDSTIIDDKKMSVEDSITFLSDESNDEVIELEDKKADKKDKTPLKVKSEDNEDEDLDEDKSIEDELEEELNEDDEPDEDLELTVPVRRKEILAKYPNLFKDFPYLQKAYYLEQKYTEIIPTIEDAKIAVEKAELLDTYEKEIMDGSTESILSAARDNDKDAFAKIVDNYLPTLHKVDEGAYYHIIGNITKHTITTMVKAGKESDSEELITAAQILNEFMFGTKAFTPPTRMSKGDDVSADDKKKETELSAREQKFTEQQFETAKSSVTNRIDNVIKSTVDKNIDPNESMTDYVRKIAIRDVLESLDSLIEKDSRFLSIYDRLWERAANDNYSTKSMDQVKAAYLSKAKTLLPALIKKSRNEALRGLGKRMKDNDDNDINDRKDKKGPLPVGNTRRSASSLNSGKADSKNGSVPKNMTSLEYLMSD